MKSDKEAVNKAIKLVKTKKYKQRTYRIQFNARLING